MCVKHLRQRVKPSNRCHANHLRLFEGRLNAVVLLDDDEITTMKDLIKVTVCRSFTCVTDMILGDESD